jgi:hypothetical protein
MGTTLSTTWTSWCWQSALTGWHPWLCPSSELFLLNNNWHIEHIRGQLIGFYMMIL